MTPTFLQLCTVLFTVAMLCVSVYFLLGSVPLLILKHDTPLDGKFIRSFFNLYYRIAAFVAGAATLTYAFSGRPWFAVGAAVIAVLSVALRRCGAPSLRRWIYFKNRCKARFKLQTLKPFQNFAKSTSERF